MNTHRTILENASTQATTSDRILQTALATWRQRNFVEVVDYALDQVEETLAVHPGTVVRFPQCDAALTEIARWLRATLGRGPLPSYPR
jgi:hypothetical protein